MAEEKKYTIEFRLYAQVELTEEEIKAVAKDDTTCIKNKFHAGEVKLGGGDSYIPLDWIRENDGIPMDLRQEFDSDIDIVAF